ncbi:hypothetical protein D3C76_1438560 [compost metagenome]
MHHLLAQGGKLQVEAGAIRLLHAVQCRQAFGQLLTGREGTRVVLLAEDFIGALHQRLGTADVLKCRQAQTGQAQQVFGLGQAPVFAACAKHGFQALAQPLLITLQLGHQAPTLFQLIGSRQLCQAR